MHRKYEKMVMKKFLGILLFCSVICTNVCAQSSLYKAIKLLEAATKMYEAKNITDKDLAEYMSKSMVQLDKQNVVLGPNDAYTKRLNRITNGITQINDIPINFKVYKCKEANAFASPDGSVRVYSQLMDLMTDDELLGIIGHELGHIANSDAKDQYRIQLIASAIRDGLMLSDGSIGILASSSLGDIGEAMINAKYSRDQEVEADAFGYDYLKSKGKNPRAMEKALLKLKAFSGPAYSKYVQQVTVLLSTHPNLDYRIELLKNRN